CIASQRSHTNSGLNGDGGTTGGASGYACFVKSVEDRSKCGVHVCRAHGEFIAVEMTDDDGLFIKQPLNRSGSIKADEIFCRRISWISTKNIRGGSEWVTF